MGLALAYPVPTRGRNTFQEEDFPALVSSTSKPSTAPTSLISAWNSSNSKKVAQPTTGAHAAGGGSQPPRKAGKGGKGSKKGGLPPTEEEEEEDSRTGLTAQELRSGSTTVTVSSLVLAPTQTFTKVSKKKKVGSEKLSATSPPPLPPDKNGHPGAEQDEQAPMGRAEGPVTVIVNGHTEESALARNIPKEPPGLPKPLGPLPCPTPQEDFPALSGPCLPRMPPPPGRCTWLRPASGCVGSCRGIRVRLEPRPEGVQYRQSQDCGWEEANLCSSFQLLPKPSRCLDAGTTICEQCDLGLPLPLCLFLSVTWGNP